MRSIVLVMGTVICATLFSACSTFHGGGIPACPELDNYPVPECHYEQLIGPRLSAYGDRGPESRVTSTHASPLEGLNLVRYPS
jgi:hypothetical protein